MKNQTKRLPAREKPEFALAFPLSAADCVRTMYDPCPEGKKDNAGCVAILKLTYLSPEYRKPEYQLFRLESGFGVNPNLSGNACFGTFCADGERCRMEKYNFFGIANKRVTDIAAELEKRRQTK